MNIAMARWPSRRHTSVGHRLGFSARAPDPTVDRVRQRGDGGGHLGLPSDRSRGDGEVVEGDEEALVVDAQRQLRQRAGGGTEGGGRRRGVRRTWPGGRGRTAPGRCRGTARRGSPRACRSASRRSGPSTTPSVLVGSSGSSRRRSTITAAASTSIEPSGQTVTTPPTGTSSGRSRSPSVVTTCTPRLPGAAGAAAGAEEADAARAPSAPTAPAPSAPRTSSGRRPSVASTRSSASSSWRWTLRSTVSSPASRVTMRWWRTIAAASGTLPGPGLHLGAAPLTRAQTPRARPARPTSAQPASTAGCGRRTCRPDARAPGAAGGPSGCTGRRGVSLTVPPRRSPVASRGRPGRSSRPSVAGDEPCAVGDQQHDEGQQREQAREQGADDLVDLVEAQQGALLPRRSPRRRRRCPRPAARRAPAR
jgi:hypothetical protein